MDGLPGDKDTARHHQGGYSELASSPEASILHEGEPVNGDEMQARVRQMKQ